MNRRTHVAILTTTLLTACGGGTPAAPAANPTSAVTPSGSAASAEPATPPSAPKAALPPPTTDEIFATLRTDLQQCYVAGKKSAPLMGEGNVTWLVSVRAGEAGCVVPSEDTGLTQEVEDCMAARLARERYQGPETFTFELPLKVRDGNVALGSQSAAPTIATIEQHGLSDAPKVVGLLLGEFSSCIQPLAKDSKLRVIHVGGRVARDGHVMCALATSTAPIPADVQACSIDVLSHAKFAPPKAGYGLVAVPLKVRGSK